MVILGTNNPLLFTENCIKVTNGYIALRVIIGFLETNKVKAGCVMLQKTFQCFILLTIVMTGLFYQKLEALEESTFLEMKTDHFTIYANTYPSDLQELSWTLEECYSIVSAAFPLFKPQVTPSIEVFVFNRLDDFNELTLYHVDTSEYRSDDDLPFGFFFNYGDKARIFIHTATFSKYLPEVFQEMGRLFVRSGMNNPPLWIEEGISTFLGGITIKDDQYVVGTMQRTRFQELKENSVITLSRFLKVARNSSLLKINPTLKETFNTQAALMVSYFFYADSKKYQKQYMQLLYNLINDMSNEDSFMKVFPEGTIPLQQSFLDYLNQHVFPTTILMKADLRADKKWKYNPADRSELDSVIADDFFRHGNLIKGQQYLSRAKNSEPISPLATLAEANFLYRQQKTDELQLVIKKLNELVVGNRNLLREYIFFLANTGQKSEALKVLLSAHKEFEEDATMVKLGYSLAQEAKDENSSLIFLSYLLQIVPAHIGYNNAIIDILKKQGKHEEVSLLLLRLALSYPDDETYVERLLTEVKMIDNQNAEATILLRANQKLTDNADIIKALADLYLELGNSHAALNYLKKYALLVDDAVVKEKIAAIEKELETRESEEVLPPDAEQ